MQLPEINANYIIFGCGGYYKQMFAGVDDHTNFQYCNDEFDKLRNRIPFRAFLRRITTSARFRRFFGVKFYNLWQELWMRYRYNYQIIGGKYAIFLFLQNNMYAHDEAFLQYLKKRHPNSKNVFWLTNTLKSHKEDLDFLERCYDLVVTFNKNDATENRFYYHEWCCKEVHVSKSRKCDLFFCGWDKGRGPELVEIFKYLSARGVKCDITILNRDGNTPIVNGIRYSDKYIDYNEVLAAMQESNCILEVLPNNSDNASTLRIAEAIAMSKKLLTNNPQVLDNSFFREEQVRIFNDLSDIDINWIITDSVTGFANANSISPEQFLYDIGSYLLIREVSTNDIN